MTLNRNQLGMAAAREQFGAWLDHIPSQYSLVSAAECFDGASPCNPNWLFVSLRANSGPPNARFTARLPLDVRKRVSGWDAFLAAIPAATVRLSAFAPIAAVLDKPNYVVSIDLPPYAGRTRAVDALADCKGAELIPDVTAPDVYAVDVAEPPSKYDAALGLASSRWLIPPDGAAILWSYRERPPLRLSFVPMTNFRDLVAAQFSPAGRLIKGYTCPD